MASIQTCLIVMFMHNMLLGMIEIPCPFHCIRTAGKGFSKPPGSTLMPIE